MVGEKLVSEKPMFIASPFSIWRTGAKLHPNKLKELLKIQRKLHPKKYSLGNS